MGGHCEGYNSHKRNLTIDFIRGIAIILVVLGHNIQYGSGTVFYEVEGYFESTLFKFIYSFHMPLFALISGYLFLGTMKNPVKQMLKKKILALILPILCWVTLECGGYIIILIIKQEVEIVDFVYTYLNKFLSSFWFLWAMFWCSLIVLFVENVFKGRVWVYGIIMFFILFMPAIYNFHMYAYMFPYFVAGFLFNKNNGKDVYQRIVKKDWHALAIVVGVFGTLLIFYRYDFYIYTSKISLLGKNAIFIQLGIDIYRWTIGFAGSITTIILCRMICNRWQGKGIKLFAYFGKISIGIYILNSYVNSYILPRITTNFTPNGVILSVETILSMIVYVVTVEMIKKIPVAKKLMLGGR